MATDPPRVNPPSPSAPRHPFDRKRRALIWPRADWATKRPAPDFERYERKPDKVALNRSCDLLFRFMFLCIHTFLIGFGLLMAGKRENAIDILSRITPLEATELMEDFIGWMCEHRGLDYARPLIYSMYDLFGSLQSAITYAVDPWESEDEDLEAALKLGGTPKGGGGCRPLILSEKLSQPVVDGIERETASSREGRA